MRRHSSKNYVYYTEEKTEYKRPVRRYNNNLQYYAFTIVLFIVGFLSGNAISYELNNKNLLGVINPVIDNIHQLSAEKSFMLLLKSFFTHFIYIFAIWFLSLTIIGIILVVFIVFFDGFMYGLVISSFTYQLGLQGFLVGFFYTFPQNIILIPLLIYVSSHSIRISLSIFKTFIQNSNRKYISQLFNQYLNQLYFAIGTLIIYALIMSIFGNVFIDILKSLI